MLDGAKHYGEKLNRDQDRKLSLDAKLTSD